MCHSHSDATLDRVTSPECHSDVTVTQHWIKAILEQNIWRNTVPDPTESPGSPIYRSRARRQSVLLHVTLYLEHSLRCCVLSVFIVFYVILLLFHLIKAGAGRLKSM